MSRHILHALVVVVVACAGPGAIASMAAHAAVNDGAAAASTSVADATMLWGDVLKHYVNADGYVDFKGLEADHAELDRYVAWVGEVGPQNHPDLFPTRDDKLAYYLNSYNAIAMWKVLKAGVPHALGFFDRQFFFRHDTITVGGQDYTFTSYEADVIRKLGDPRVHFALNCMSESCPRLPREPFVADGLDQRLDQLAQKFFAEPRNVRLDAADKTVHFSEILKFYTDDFLAKAPSLIAYANRYRAADAQIPADYAVEFIDYDWTIIRQH
ncbi:MAG: DUF547 domain-containing protein [Rhodanobacteraceae bacterium]